MMKNERERMIDVIRVKYGLDSPEVLSAMLRIPRDKFTSKENRKISYDDSPVPIGFSQTMSQPYTVAFMTHLLVGNRAQGLRNKRIGKVLEIGTGSGYQAAILSYFFDKVYTVEIVPELAEKAKKTLEILGYKNVFVKAGSGEWGWQKYAPYDAVIITAGLRDKVPDALLDQLKVGGVLVAPMGPGYDKVMRRYTKFKIQKSKIKIGKEGKVKIVRIGNFFYKVEEFAIFHFVPFVEERK